MTKWIAKYQTHFGYRPRPFRSKLTREQRETYDEFQRRLDVLRNFLDRKGITSQQGKRT